MADAHVRRMTRLTKMYFYTLALSVLGFAFTPYDTIIAGFMLGMTIGFIGLIFLAKKVNQFVQAVKDKKATPPLGSVMRVLLAGLGVAIVIKYPEHFNVIGLAIGLVYPTVLAIGDAIYFHIKYKE